MPHLEREFLKELRDFLLCGMRAFRRLLLGLHQDSGDVVEVFRQWREWRSRNGVGFSNGDRTTYYAQAGFSSDFFHFVRSHYIPGVSKAPLAMTVLLDYEEAVLAKDHEATEANDQSERVSSDIERLLGDDSRPQLLPGVNVIELQADYREIVRRLRQKIQLHDVPSRPVRLAIRRTPAGPVEALQLSPLSAQLLDLCVDGLTVQEMAGEFLTRGIEISGVTPRKLCLAGIEILRQQRLIGLA